MKNIFYKAGTLLLAGLITVTSSSCGQNHSSDKNLAKDNEDRIRSVMPPWKNLTRKMKMFPELHLT